MTHVDFTKYEGLGNDFLLFDDLDERLDLAGPVVSRLCDRHLGVGADGVILVRPSETADARMLFFNPDGSEAEICGNGIRAFAKYLHDRGLTPKTQIAVETKGGTKTVVVDLRGDGVAAAQVDMGIPTFASKDVPVALPTTEAVNVPIDVDGEILTATCVSMGNPHCVLFVDDLETAPVDRLGRALEMHPVFPARTNVEFVQVVQPDSLAVRVWERGAGETLACGTGACAAAVAAARTGRAERKTRVRLPGGALDIRWEGDGTVFMSGPVNEVFRGTVDLDRFAG